MTEFDDVIRLLREQRPEATPLELDQIKQRVRRRAEHGSRRNQPMKSRLAILGMLVTGMLFTTTGAGVAVTSLTSGHNAAVQSYGGNQGTTPAFPKIGGEKPRGGVEGVQRNRPNRQQPQSDEQPAGGVAGAQDTAPTALQPTRQVEVGATSDENTLPFTGFAAIPVLMIGIALLAGGFVLRRRAGDTA